VGSGQMAVFGPSSGGGGGGNPGGSVGDLQYKSGASTFGGYTPGTGVVDWLQIPSFSNLNAALTGDDAAVCDGHVLVLKTAAGGTADTSASGESDRHAECGPDDRSRYYPHSALLGESMMTIPQDAEKVSDLTHPTPVRQDAPFTKQRSRIAQRLDVPKRFSEVGSITGAYPVAKTHCKGERPTRSVERTSSPLRSLRPCLGQGASRRARAGRVRSLTFLSILCMALPFVCRYAEVCACGVTE